ncbi:uncharacterized protein JCM6883_000105, partial [Sporobolomyces salmoneus]
VEKQKIKLGINKYQFDQNQVNQAFKEVESRSKFDAPVIFVHSQ